MPEAGWFESRRHGELIDLRIVVRLCFGGRDVADRFEQAAVVEPVDPFEGCVFDRFKAAPWAAPVNHLGLEEPDHCLGERVVVAVADAIGSTLQIGSTPWTAR